MNINPLSLDLIHVLSPESGGIGASTSRVSVDDSGFSNVLSDAFRDAARMDAADKRSGLELLVGEADDFAGLLIDAQKAELSLNLALQIRNKIIDSYNEIMRIQV